MHRTDVFNSLRNVKTEPIFNDVKENRKYFMVLKSISIYSQESIHKECPHIFRNFWPPPPVTTVDIWLTSPPPSYPSSPPYSTLFMRIQNLNMNATPNIHLHHPSLYTNTKKMSQKVKYLLTRLIPEGNKKKVEPA